MKVSCIRENLAKGLGIVGRSVGTKVTLPVLSNILLKTEKGGLKLSATDLEIGIHTWIGAKVDADGAITIPSKILLDYINTNSDKKIIMELKEANLHLESDHFKANIKGIDAAEFPTIPEVKKKSGIEISSTDFLRAVGKTLIAVALDESRPVLSGIYFSIRSNILKMAATDSYRLAEQELKLSKKIEEDINFIVPQRTMAEILRLLSDAVDKIIIYPGENQVEFSLGETVLVSRLIEGAFPDYTQIIPGKLTTKMIVGKSEFTSAIKMASLFARESANNIKLKVAAGNKISVIASSPHLGDNVSEVSGEVTGEGLEIAFNAKFILDILAVEDSEKIILEFSGGLSPAMLRGEKHADYFYIIMPLRIEE